MAAEIDLWNNGEVHVSQSGVTVDAYHNTNIWFHSEPYSGFSNSIIFTDGGSAEGVEYPDFMFQLSPQMQAQWAEMEQELTDPEMVEMFEGMEGME